MRPIDEIRRGLAEVWESKGRAFVTFEPPEGRGAREDEWVQYLDGELNVRWPLAEEPATALARHGVAVPRGAFLVFWRPEENALFAVGDVLLDDLAAFVDRLFARVLAEEAYEVTARIEQA